MPRLGDLNIPRQYGNIGHPERLSGDLKSVGQKLEPFKQLATEGFGQVLLGDEGTIPRYASLVPGADLTDKLMEVRQPGLLDVPGPGTLAKMAMVPVAKFGSKEILKGTARMGKTARNVDRAIDNRNFVTRFHRTETANVPSIQQEGLRLKDLNENYGKHTRDSERIDPVVWLGVSPRDIPVLRDEYLKHPENVSQFEVKIPKGEYYDLPRMMYPEGRGSGRPKVVKKGEPSLTDEGHYKIDMVAASIPPEYLKLMDVPQFNSADATKKHYDKVKLASLLVADDDVVGKLPKRLRKEAEDLLESTYDLEDSFGPDMMISNMYTPKQLSEMVDIVANHPTDKAIKNAGKYTMEGAVYENPAEMLDERVRMMGGFIPSPGNGKRFAVVDAENFNPHKGRISAAEDWGTEHDGIGYTNAIKSYKSSNIQSPEDHRALLEHNFDVLMHPEKYR